MSAFLSSESFSISTSGVGEDRSWRDMRELAVVGVTAPGVGARSGCGEVGDVEGADMELASAFQNFGLPSCPVSSTHFKTTADRSLCPAMSGC